MGKSYDEIDPSLAEFIKAQQLFFVATAPLAQTGHVNLSPKGLNSFRILNPLTVAYLDFGGSGIETQAHLQENNRLTIMFCAFEGPAKILRLYGKGRAISAHTSESSELYRRHFDGLGNARAIIELAITRIADSCGWGVPLYEYKGRREQLSRWANNVSQEAFMERRYARNARSIDDLPGLIPPETSP